MCIRDRARRIASFTAAMAAVARALSRTPRTSSTEAMAMTSTAGRLTRPPSPGPADRAAGSWRPVMLRSSSLTYSLQPTATAEMEMPYSSSRHQPTRKAVDSPRPA